MSDSVKLPKHVAGVKIPKPLRHAVEAALEQAATPAGRRLIAAVLTAAAAALVRDLPDADERPEAGKPRPSIDMGALMGVATSVIGGLRAASERKPDAAPGKPGEA